MQEFTTAEVAERIGKPLGTVKRWLDRVPVPHRMDGRGARKFDERAIEVLEQVRGLVDSGRTLESVRVILAPALVTEREAGPRTGRDPEAGQPQAAGDPEMNDQERPVRGSRADHDLDRDGIAAGMDMTMVVATLRGELVAAVREQNELAEKYARVAHMVGGLERDLAHAKAEAQRLAEAGIKREAELEVVRLELRDTAAVAARARELELMLTNAQAGSSLRRRAEEERDRVLAELARRDEERSRLEEELRRAKDELDRVRIASSPQAARPWWKIWG